MNHANATMSAPAAPMNPLPGAIDRLSVALNDLEATAEALGSRLSRVCTSPMETATDQAKDPSAVCANSDMVQDVNRQRERIERICAGLQDVLNRLEV